MLLFAEKIGPETWTIVLATFLGPVFAIAVTRWRDRLREIRARQLWIFRALLSTRRQIMVQDHVAAINLIEVDFYGVRAVQEAWKVYGVHLNSWTNDRPMNEAERKNFEHKRNDLLAKLIFAIELYLGFKLSEIDIRNGGYAPDEWRLRDNRFGAIQDYVVSMSKGQAALPVRAKPE